MEKYAVIMAGGAGLRLWPLSRESTPKQFISLNRTKSLLFQSIERICELIPPENCFVITNAQYVDLARETVKDLIPSTNLLLEPLRKNTAACVSYATLFLDQKFGEGTICFLPADSYIGSKHNYLSVINQAFEAAHRTNELIVVGIKPTYPATGYGYIQATAEHSSHADGAVKVLKFKEKPDVSAARQYMESNHYLWNSGIVAGQIGAFIQAMKQCIPDHLKILSEAFIHHNQPEFQSIILENYNKLNDVSFDHGVLEKTESLHVVKGDFDWSDIGSLDALPIAFDRDAYDNAVHGMHLGIDTNDTVIYSTDSLVTTIGLDSMIIVDAGDSILVCSKERAQDVKVLVELLKKNGLEKYT